MWGLAQGIVCREPLTSKGMGTAGPLALLTSSRADLGESRGLEVHDEQPGNLLVARIGAVVKDVEDSSRALLESAREEELLTVEAKPPPPRALRVRVRVR